MTELESLLAARIEFSTDVFSPSLFTRLPNGMKYWGYFTLYKQVAAICGHCGSNELCYEPPFTPHNPDLVVVHIRPVCLGCNGLVEVIYD